MQRGLCDLVTEGRCGAIGACAAAQVETAKARSSGSWGPASSSCNPRARSKTGVKSGAVASNNPKSGSYPVACSPCDGFGGPMTGAMRSLM